MDILKEQLNRSKELMGTINEQKKEGQPVNEKEKTMVKFLEDILAGNNPSGKELPKSVFTSMDSAEYSIMKKIGRAWGKHFGEVSFSDFKKLLNNL